MTGGNIALVAAAIFGAAACGGPSAEAPTTAPAPARSAVHVEREPIRVDFDAARYGESLRLDVRGIGRGVIEGEPFEDPERWNIHASADGAALPRLVNGPVRIDRNPVGGAYSNRWDTVVRFSVVYQVPATAEKIEVRVHAPSGPPVTRVVRL